MATRNQVLSLFGASPEQIMERQRQEQAEMLQQIRDPYQQTGTAIGMALGNMFGGESAEVREARDVQNIASQVQSELGSPQLTEDMSPEERLQATLTSSYELYNKLADAYAKAGYPQYAQQAVEKSIELGSSLLGVQEKMAGIAFTEARTQAELTPDPTDTKSIGNVSIPGRNGTFVSAIRNGVPVYKDRDNEWKEIPSSAKFISGDQGRIKPGALSQYEAESLYYPIIKADPIAGELSTEEQSQLSIDLAARVDQIIGDPESGVTNRSQAARIAIGEFKRRGLLKTQPSDSWFNFFNILEESTYSPENIEAAETTSAAQTTSSEGISLVTSQEDYDKLEPGAKYRLSDGTIATKGQ